MITRLHNRDNFCRFCHTNLSYKKEDVCNNEDCITQANKNGR